MGSALTLDGRLVAGKYEILRKLGEGGMAEIYLARLRGAARITKHVVLKRIRPALADQTEVVSMFLDEARLAVRLEHPNVAQVYEILEAEGGYFLVMEYLQGVDLLTAARAQPDRRLPLELALSTMAGACAGLHYAHELCAPSGVHLGIVHRDVSLTNLFVTRAGTIKVLDFGIASAIDRVTKTDTGVLRGKLAYLSPEQVLGQAADRRADVFALGVVLYELTLGRRPFDRPGDPDLFVMQRISESEYTAPGALDPQYPPALEQIVHTALARDPQDRFATADDMQIAVERAAERLGIRCSPRALARFAERCRKPTSRTVDADNTVPQRNHLAAASAAELWELPNQPTTATAPSAMDSEKEPPAAAVAAHRPGRRSRLAWAIALLAVAASAFAVVWTGLDRMALEYLSNDSSARSTAGNQERVQSPPETAKAPAPAAAPIRADVSAPTTPATVPDQPQATREEVRDPAVTESAEPAPEVATAAKSAEESRRPRRRRRGRREGKAAEIPKTTDAADDEGSGDEASWTRNSAFPPRVP